MDHSDRIIKRWRALHKICMGILAFACMINLLEFIFDPDSVKLNEVYTPIFALFMFFIWYAIADHFACVKRGHKFILFYLILRIFGMIVDSSSMIYICAMDLVPSLLEDTIGPGLFLKAQGIVLALIVTVSFGFIAHSSCQLYKINRARNKRILEAGLAAEG